MVPKFAKAGTSFKGVVQYLSHDAGHATTADRVAWIYTLNLAHDHLSSAVHEMYSTWDSAGLLKANAGLTTGSTVEKPVKHVSLNWHRSESPDRAEMIRAAQSFLKAMTWQDHQCIVIAHREKHPHVHLVISAIHPETGCKLKDAFEFSRAQAWALAYEQERGQILCPQRLLPAHEREPAPPRPVWLLLEQSVNAQMRAEVARMIDAPDAREARVEAERLEWKVLRELQKEERLAFFEGGRAAYKQVRDTVYRGVRKELKAEWAALYSAQRGGADPASIAAMKAELTARQKEMLETRRDEACAALRLGRDAAYRVLLDRQKDQRAELQERQERNLGGSDLLQHLAGAHDTRQPSAQTEAKREDEETAGRRQRQPAVDHPHLWTQRAGMVAQQRSALRWLDKVADRARASPQRQRSQPGQAALDRIYGVKEPRVAPDLGPAKDDRGMEHGPD